MKRILPAVFVIWLLVIAQVSYAQSLSAASAAPSAAEPSEADTAAGDVAPVADDTCQTAVESSLGSWDSLHLIWPSGEVDWFKWNLPGDGRFTVDVDVPSNRDYDVAVYKSCTGSPVCISDKGKGYDEQCSIDASSSGWIYAKVYGYNGDSGLLDFYSIKGSLSRSYDLTPTLSTSPSSPNSRDTINIQYGAINQGPNTITTGFNSKLYIDNSLKQTCSQNVNLPSNYKGTCTYPTTLSAGSHTLKVVADADNNVAETNENNNQYQTTLNVARHVDLRVTDIYTVPSSPNDQSSFKIGYTLRNDGSDSTPLTFLSKVYVNNAFWVTCTHNGGIGAVSSQNCELSDNRNWVAGTYTIKVVADSDNNVPEYNEGNNEYSEQVTIIHRRYDLVPGDFTVTPSNPSRTDSITVRYMATNNGPDTITSPYNYKLYIDESLKQTCLSSGNTPSGSTGYCDLTGITLTPGTHTLKNVVDADNQIPETNEANNIKTQNLVVAGCSDPANPYFCERTDGCWPNKARCDAAITCGGQWWACNDPGTYNAKCVDGKAGCCPPQNPYYCPGNDFCFSSNSYCDGRPVKSCNGKYQVCNTKTDVGTCFGDVLRCCPSGESWWESDKQCHRSAEPQKCTVPDGTSSLCACRSRSDCPSSKPYCSKDYPSPISDGYGRCMTSVPEYCGNGNCGYGETYSSCRTDCAYLAPKGTITVDVYYNSGANVNKPIGGASVSLDGVQQSVTDSNGKASFHASYGSRNVKVNCPDNNPCAERTVNVDGTKSLSMGCNCNPSTDSDGDGYLNADENLLGTDPNDAGSNFATTFGSDSVDLVACLPTPATLLIIWKESLKNGGDLIQANQQVMSALNVTQVTSASVMQHPYVVADAVVKADLDAELVVPDNVTLESAVKRAEYVDGIYTQNELLLIATDKDTGTTAIIAIGAGCVGAFGGAVYGIGQGITDDVKGIVQGIWFVVTHADDLTKIWGGAKQLVSGVQELLKNPGALVWSLFRDILKKGKGVNLFTGNKEAYRHFQVGFVYGFVGGYLVEQVVLSSIIFEKVADAFKFGGKLLGITGKAYNIEKKLAIVRDIEEFGEEIAAKLGELKYANKLAEWTNEEVKGLARIAKHNDGWAKGLSEAEAKAASKHVDTLYNVKKLGDGEIANLVESKIGKKTLTLTEASNDLLAKQSKLVEKWGVSKADDVISKCVLFVCYGNRIDDLNKILKAMPENLINDFSPDRAVKFLGDKKLIEAAEAVATGVDKTTISQAANGIAEYEKLLEYTKAVKKMDPSIVNPLGDIGKHQLLLVIKNPSVATRVGDQTVDGIAVLKKGNMLEKWGWEEISVTRADGVNHAEQIQKALGLANNDEAVKRVIAEVIESSNNVKHIPGDKFEFTKIVTRGQKSHNILVVVSDRVGDIKINKGSIQTAHPFD